MSAMIDLRRPDQRDTVLQNPFWMTSSLIEFSAGNVLTPGYSPSVKTPVAIKGTGAITAATLAASDANPDTITDSGNGLAAAGFLANDVVYISGFTGAGAAANLEFATIDAGGVAVGSLTMVAGDALTADAAGEAVTVQTMKPVLLFSFPVAGKRVVIHEVAVQVVTAFTATTEFILGDGTIATDVITTGGVLTTVAKSSFVLNGATLATPAYYGPGTTSAWYTAAGLNGFTSPRTLLGAAATVPCIMGFFGNAAVIAAGALRVHLLVSYIPGF